MISVIKTAIITIIISFISGWLLDYYKSLAPRIFCTIGDAIPLELNNKKICAYILTVRNISSKIVHDLTLNVQGSQNNLKIGDAKITKGLKFDSSIKNNILDVDIPFLSKDDEFSVTLYLENQYGEYNKPVIILRSPENFKEVDSVDETGILSLLFDIPKNIVSVVLNIMKKNETTLSNKNGNLAVAANKSPNAKKTINKQNREVTYRSKKTNRYKKVIIATISIILVMLGGILGKFYFDNISVDTQNAIANTNVQKQSGDSAKLTGETNKNTDTKAPTSSEAKNSGTKNQKDGTTPNTKTSTNETSKTENTKTAPGETTENTKISTSETNKNTDAKTPTSDKTGSTNTKPPIVESTDAKISPDETTKNTDAKAPTGNTTENTDAKTSTPGTTGNTDN